MEGDNRHINTGQENGSAEGEIADDPEESTDMHGLIIIIRGLQQHGEVHRCDQDERGIFCYNRHPAFEKAAGYPVRPLGLEGEGEDAERVVFDKIFDVAASQDGIGFDPAHPLPHLLDQFFAGQAFDIRITYFGPAQAAEGEFLQPEVGGF